MPDKIYHKMPSTISDKVMPDKYDEVACEMSEKFIALDDFEVAAFLRSAFPPPAEDARQAYSNIQKIEEANILPATGLMNPKVVEEAAAEISRFAESRVEPWREAIKKIACDEISPLGDVCPEDYDRLRSIARALLSDSTAKEDAK